MSEQQALTAKPSYILGLDLGQISDFTALVILERRRLPETEDDPRTLVSHYGVRHIRRWQLKTPYTIIVDEVVELVAAPALEYPKLAVDITGVGRPILDMLKAAKPQAHVRPVGITPTSPFATACASCSRPTRTTTTRNSTSFRRSTAASWGRRGSS